MENCYCCGKLVTSPNEKKRRRLLSSPAMLSVLETLSTLLLSKFPGVDSSKLHTGYACRSCDDRLCAVISNLQNALPVLPKLVATQETGTLHPSSASADHSPERLAPCTSAGKSPLLTAKIHYQSRPQTFNVTPSRRRICKPLIRRSYTSFAVNCVRNNEATKAAIVKVIGQELQKEVVAICSDKFNSVTRQKSNDVIADFNYVKQSLLKEMATKAPTLLTLLKHCLHTRKPRKNTDAILVVVMSLLCKHRRPSACQLQRIVSLILYAGHASKQVFQRLQKIGLSMSHSSTIRLLRSLGTDFDSRVKQWKETAEKGFASLQVDNQTNTPNDNFLHTSYDDDFDFSIADFSKDDLQQISISSSSPASPLPVLPASPASPMMLSPLHPQVMYVSGPLTSTPVKAGQSVDVTSESELLTCSSESPDSSTLMDITASDISTTDLTAVEANPVATSLSLLFQPSCSFVTPISPVPSMSLEMVVQLVSAIAGFKFVFDNLDTTIKPRHMTADSQTQSVHNVQGLAIKDRIDYSTLPSQRSGDSNLYDILPNACDYSALKNDFVVLVSRVITEHLAFFREDFKRLVQKHIPHKYSAEMSKKSEVVPLGVLPKNETKHEEMMDILEEYQQYVPSKVVTLEEPTPGENHTEDVSYITTLLGGDYLSVARAREAQYIRRSSELQANRFDGLMPVAEDWHAKVCFLEVVWKRLFRTSSGMERGTLYQIRNLINRRNVKKKPKSDVNASEDFLEVVVVAYILAATMSHLGMKSFDDMPLEEIVSHEIWMQDVAVRQTLLNTIAKHIVDEYVFLATEFKDLRTKADAPDHDAGSVMEYSRELLSLGLLFLDFKDAVKEGDGDRDMLIWKYFMLVFKATGRKNYAIEALTLLSQYHLTLPPNLAEQLKWSRFVNTHGLPGHNISCDLHMEHCNRSVKTAIDGLGANKTKKAIGRVGRALGVLDSVTQSFDKDLGVPVPSGRHSDEATKEDLKAIVEQLLVSGVFDPTKKHKSFPSLKANLIKTLSEDDVKEWMVNRFTILHMQPVQHNSMQANATLDNCSICDSDGGDNNSDLAMEGADSGDSDICM